MASLKILSPQSSRVETRNPTEIKNLLNDRGILFEQWNAQIQLTIHDSQETVLKAYDHELGPFMQRHGYINADVINVHPQMPNLNDLRLKFLSEHTHSEDEIRFFVDGQGMFYFHLDQGSSEIIQLLCEKGDFISVPKGVKHWFDLAPHYFVKAIRIFKDKEGWIALYTDSKVEKDYIYV